MHSAKPWLPEKRSTPIGQIPQAAVPEGYGGSGSDFTFYSFRVLRKVRYQ